MKERRKTWVKYLKNKKSLPVVLLLLMPLFMIFINIPTVQANGNPLWWDFDYHWRIPLVITGSTIGPLTNYPVAFDLKAGIGVSTGNTIYLNNTAQADFGDIRFVEDDMITELSYWLVDNYTWSYPDTRVWVNVTSIPTSPATETIYMYWDNPSVDTTSEGDDVFPFFDDFEGDDDPGDWTNVSGGGLQNTAAIVLGWRLECESYGAADGYSALESANRQSLIGHSNSYGWSMEWDQNIRTYDVSSGSSFCGAALSNDWGHDAVVAAEDNILNGTSIYYRDQATWANRYIRFREWDDGVPNPGPLQTNQTQFDFEAWGWLDTTRGLEPVEHWTYLQMVAFDNYSYVMFNGTILRELDLLWEHNSLTQGPTFSSKSWPGDGDYIRIGANWVFMRPIADPEPSGEAGKPEGIVISSGVEGIETNDCGNWVFEGRIQYIFYVNVSVVGDIGSYIDVGMGFYDLKGNFYSFMYDNETRGMILDSPEDGISASINYIETGSSWVYVEFVVMFNPTISDTMDVDIFIRIVSPILGDSGWFLDSSDVFNIYNLGGFTTLETSGWAGRTVGGDAFEIYAADTRTQNIMPIEDFNVRNSPLPPVIINEWYGPIPWAVGKELANEGPLLEELHDWLFWMSQRTQNQTITVTNRLPEGAGIDDDAYNSYPFGLRVLANPITTNGLIAEKEFLRQIDPADNEIVKVQVYAMTPETNGTTGKILITDDGYYDDLISHSALNSLQVVDMVFSGGGWIRLTDGVAGYIYPAAYTGLTWYNFTFVIDCNTQSYDFYVDEVLKANDVDFRQKVAGADTVGFISIMDVAMEGNYTDIYVDDIKAWTDWSGDYGGEALATTLYNRLQHWTMGFGFGVEEGKEYVKGPSATPADTSDDYSNHGYVELGWDVCINGTWELNFLVARVNITDGVIRNMKDCWVEYTITWTQNGTIIKTDTIYGLFEGYKIRTAPGAKDTTQFYWDMWFTKENFNTVVGGRISTKFFGMSEEAFLGIYWGSNWRPLDDTTMSDCYVDLIDSDDDLHQIKEVGLIRSWVRVFRTSQSTFHYSITNIESLDFVESKDTMSGIGTPPYIDTVSAKNLPNGPGGFLVSVMRSIFEDISDVIIFGGMSMWTAMLAFLDIIPAFLGIPNFTSSVISILSGLYEFVSLLITENFVVNMINTIFTIITSTFGHILQWFGAVISMFLEIFTIVWGIIDGTYTITSGLGNLWELIAWNSWVEAVPLFIIISWLIRLTDADHEGKFVETLFADIRIMIMLMGFFLTVATFVIDNTIGLVLRVANFLRR